MKVLRAEWAATAATPEGFPPPGLPEIAFLGRSNVGKSSLLNRLVQRKALARTSSTPGKTRMLHWFLVETSGGPLHFVDLPGYGYAKVARRERAGWQKLVESYLEGRETLRAAVLLQDLRRDLSEDETLLLEWLAEREVPALLAITKIDKLKLGKRTQRLRALKQEAPLPAQRVIATSAERGDGIPDLWRAISALL